MIDKRQLKGLIGRTLRAIGKDSPEARLLIIGTIAQESALGTYIKQVRGPALGICQMERATFYDHVEWMAREDREMFGTILDFTGCKHYHFDFLEWNLALSIAMCRVHYWRDPQPLPSSVQDCAAYWKRVYNTHLGAGTEQQFTDNYHKYIGIK